MSTWLALILMITSSFSMLSCGGTPPAQPLDASREAEVVEELAGRSFRKFEPHLDASRRQGVIIDFTAGVSLWAQYAESGQALNEWEIAAGSYRVEGRRNGSEITIRLVEPRTLQIIPSSCEGCIPAPGVSLSVRNVFDGESMEFRVNDPEGVLPPPFPVFGSWTKFREDEQVD